MWLLQKVKDMFPRKKYFSDLADEWLEYKSISIKQSTYFKYSYCIDRYLKANLEDVTLKNIEHFDFNEVTRKLSEELSAKTIREILNILKGILKYTETKYGVHVNLELITSPKVKIEDLKILTKREKNRLEKYCLKQEDLRHTGILVCLYTGLRIGEMCALRWENIDLERRVIRVEQTLQRIYANGKTKIIIDAPKTENSIRSIPISNKLYEILKPLKGKHKKEDFFLTGSSEKFIEPRNYQYLFKLCLKNSKVKDYKFHILRHTFATNCIEVGMDIKSLSEILGHSSVDITLNRYVHSSFKTKKKFLEKL